MLYSDSIVALATPSGAGAIAVIRISGPEAMEMCVFYASKEYPG
jgi:tRNA modification GTPase